MFLLTAPTRADVDDFLANRGGDTFSYTEIGATLGPPPAGYKVDHNRVLLGGGAETFDRAKTAIREWKMFDLPWVRLLPKDAPIRVTVNPSGSIRLRTSAVTCSLCRIAAFSAHVVCAL